MVSNDDYHVNNDIMYFAGLRHMLSKQDGNYFIRQRMLKNNTLLNASMLLFKKSKYEDTAIDWTNYKFCGDWLLWIHLMNNSNVLELGGKVLNYFRKHESNVSNKALINGLDQLEKVKLWSRLVELDLISKYTYYKLMFFMWVDMYSNKNINKLIKIEIKKILIQEMGYFQFLKLRVKNSFGLFKVS
jgi:hypothetical protein